MRERTLAVIEFVSEACSTFCDTYYRQGCGDCPLNLNEGYCLLMDFPEIIKESVQEHLTRFEEKTEEGSNEEPDEGQSF